MARIVSPYVQSALPYLVCQASLETKGNIMHVHFMHADKLLLDASEKVLKEVAKQSLKQRLN